MYSNPVIYKSINKDLELNVVNSEENPLTLKLEVPVWIKCILVNRSDWPMELVLDSDEKHSAIRIHGLTKYKLGVLNKNNGFEFGVLIFP